MTEKSRSPWAARRRQMALFARNFLKHPRMLGSVIPSSRFLIDRVLEPIDWQRARVVVEYGPGVGTLTAEMLRRMRSDAMLIAFETNHDFVTFLSDTLKDPRLHVVEGSAADVADVLDRTSGRRVDAVVSGIPFSTIDAATGEAILRATRDVLGVGGVFVVYQFSGRVLPRLRETFRHVKTAFEPRNVLPARIFYCRS